MLRQELVGKRRPLVEAIKPFSEHLPVRSGWVMPTAHSLGG